MQLVSLHIFVRTCPYIIKLNGREESRFVVTLRGFARTKVHRHTYKQQIYPRKNNIFLQQKRFTSTYEICRNLYQYVNVSFE
jgi:hypothetical protein